MRIVFPLSAALAASSLVACENGPTSPRYGLAEVANAFATLAAEASPDGTPTNVACPAGGSFRYQRSTSTGNDGGVTIRRTQQSRRYEDCGMTRGATVVIANGELAYEGEEHLVHEAAPWPEGVLLQTGHHTGVLTMHRDGAEADVCEYDVVEQHEPAAGLFSHRGTACGVSIDRSRKLW